MMKTGLKMILAGLLLVAVAVVAGCGSGSGSTSGTITNDITVTDLSGGTYAYTASATFTPAMPSTEIKYSLTFAGSSTDVKSGTLYSDATGKVTLNGTVVQDLVPVLITFTASTGGLSSTKIISVPAIAPLTVTPQAVAFINTDTAGATKTVAIAGGFSPYTASSAAPGDISATVSGTTATITKLTASGVTNTSTIVTITDNKGNKQEVVVGYFR